MATTTRKTKNAGALTKTTTVASGEALIKTDTSGKLTAIELEQLKVQILGSANLEALYDGVFIMYNTDNGFPLLARPDEWPSMQSSGKVALGVAVALPGRMLVVAPTESNDLPLSSGASESGQTYVTDIATAQADMDGKTKTAAIVAASSAEAITNTAAYAPGYCNLYSRVNANGTGLTAGKWWLPSVGELMVICANLRKINYCLGIITGGVQFSTYDWFISSTEFDKTGVWKVYLRNATIDHTSRTNTGKARPVSAFIR